MKYFLIIFLVMCFSMLIHAQDYSKENIFLKVEIDSSKSELSAFTLKISNISTSKICMFDTNYPTDVQYTDTTIMNVDFTTNFITDPYVSINKELELLFLNPGESHTKKIKGRTEFSNFREIVIDIEFFVQHLTKGKKSKRIFKKEPKTIVLRKYWPMKEKYVKYFFWRMDT